MAECLDCKRSDCPRLDKRNDWDRAFLNCRAARLDAYEDHMARLSQTAIEPLFVAGGSPAPSTPKLTTWLERWDAKRGVWE